MAQGLGFRVQISDACAGVLVQWVPLHALKLALKNLKVEGA